MSREVGEGCGWVGTAGDEGGTHPVIKVVAGKCRRTTGRRGATDNGVAYHTGPRTGLANKLLALRRNLRVEELIAGGQPRLSLGILEIGLHEIINISIIEI